MMSADSSNMRSEARQKVHDIRKQPTTTTNDNEFIIKPSNKHKTNQRNWAAVYCNINQYTLIFGK
jgi:hypothetical protein